MVAIAASFSVFCVLRLRVFFADVLISGVLYEVFVSLFSGNGAPQFEETAVSRF